MTIAKRLILLLTISLAGCASKPKTPLPVYAWVDDTAAVRALAERAKSVQTLSATCGLTLTKPDGQSVALDAILLSAPPDKLRLQASKFGQKLFDLTMNPDGLFVRVDDPSRKDKVVPASLSAARFAREWATFNGGLFDAPDLSTSHTGPDTLVVTRRSADGVTVACEVEKSTLTPRLYRMTDPAGAQRFTLAIPDYRLVNGQPYPDRMVAKSEQGTIEINMREVTVNEELTPAAFVPPPRAERVGDK